MQTSIFKFVYSFANNYRDIELQTVFAFEKKFFESFLNSLKSSVYFSENFSFQKNIESLFGILLKLILKCSHIMWKVKSILLY